MNNNIGIACKITTGKLDANQAIQNGQYPFYTCAEFPDTIDSFAFDDDVVLVAGNNAKGNFHVNRFKGKFNAYQRTYVLTAKKGFDIDFIYYSLKLELKRLKEKSQGSQTKFLTMPILQNIGLKNLSESEQKQISSVLSTLDEKIALNNQINATLEQMAKTLYDYWFVQFDFPDENGKPYKSSGGEMVYNETLKRDIPKGWGVKKLDDVMRIVRGASPRPIDDFIQDSGIPWIKISDATSANTPFIFETKQFIKESGKSYSRYLIPNTLILSNSASPGIPKIVQIDCCVHDGWLIIDDFKENIFNEFMYFYFLNFKAKIENMGSGSVFKNLKTDYIKELDIVLPSEEILKQSKVILESTFEKLKNSENENLILTKLRDWLLPMLMNGQVTVQ